jgi:hypothetical protein
MARTQRVSFADRAETYTVLGADHLPVPVVVDYLQFLRDDAASPHTIRAYAAGLAAWWTVLEHTGIDWREIPTRLFGEFMTYLRTGDLPGTARIGEPGDPAGGQGEGREQHDTDAQQQPGTAGHPLDPLVGVTGQKSEVDEPVGFQKAGLGV